MVHRPKTFENSPLVENKEPLNVKEQNYGCLNIMNPKYTQGLLDLKGHSHIKDIPGNWEWFVLEVVGQLI